MKTIDMFDVAVFMVGFALTVFGLGFLCLVIKNWKNPEGKLRFLSLMWYSYSGLIFLIGLCSAIEGKGELGAIFFLIASMLFAIFGYACREVKKNL